MENFFAMRVSVPPDVLISQISGESVILNLKSERYLGLDDVGTRMWGALTKSPSIQVAYDALLTEYDVDAEVLRQDLHAFVEKLIQQGLVEVSAG